MVSHTEEAKSISLDKNGCKKIRGRCYRCSVCGDQPQCEVNLEWTWKPLAAKMNEKLTDLVYWKPPLYSSNIMVAIINQSMITARPKGSIRKRKSSRSIRKTNLMADRSITDVASTQEKGTVRTKGSVRMQKLTNCRRKDTLVADNSITYEKEITTQVVATIRPQSSARKRKLSSSRRRNKLMAHNSMQEDLETPTNSVATTMPKGSVWKRKLSSYRRRETIIALNSIVLLMEATTKLVETDSQQSSFSKTVSRSWGRTNFVADDNIIEEIEEDEGTIQEDLSSMYCMDTKDTNSTIIVETLPEDYGLENQVDKENKICKTLENPQDFESAAKIEELENTVKVRKMKLSSSRRRSKLMANASTTEEMKEEHGSTINVRKKKLSSSRRRDRIKAENRMKEDMEKTDGSNVNEDESSLYSLDDQDNNVSILGESLPEGYECKNQNDNESKIYDKEHGSTVKVRKKKLSSSRRRDRLKAENIIKEDMEKDRSTVNEDECSLYSLDDRDNNLNILGESLPEDYEWKNQNDNESRLYEMTVENQQESSKAMESSRESNKEMGDKNREISMNNAPTQNKPGLVKYDSNKSNKSTGISTLFKLIEKLSRLHVRNCDNESKNNSKEINNRPSLKVYKRQMKLSLTHSNTSITSFNKALNQEDGILTSDPLLTAKPSITGFNIKQSQYKRAVSCESGFFEEYDTDNEDSTSGMENLHNTQRKNQNDNESRLYEITENHQESSKAMESSRESNKEMSDKKREISMNNVSTQNKPGLVKYDSNKSNKSTGISTLFKLIEKLSHLHVRKCDIESKNNSKERNKRPLVKVYQRQRQLSSTHSNTSITSINKALNKEDRVITSDPLLAAKPSITCVNIKPLQYKRSVSGESGFFEESNTDSEVTTSGMENLYSTQQQAMLHSLAELYEKKMRHKEMELDHLQTYVQTQNEVMMQLVQVSMELKANLDNLKNKQKLEKKSKTLTEKLNNDEQLHSSRSFTSNFNKK
ncbi:unnamed protein product, partial [Meganyctiphanes norvegica]